MVRRAREPQRRSRPRRSRAPGSCVRRLAVMAGVDRGRAGAAGRTLRPSTRPGWMGGSDRPAERGPRGRRTRWAHARSGLERRVPGVGREESATGDEAGLREGAPVTLRLRLGLVVATVMCIITGGLLASGRSQPPFAATRLPPPTRPNLPAVAPAPGKRAAH